MVIPGIPDDLPTREDINPGLFEHIYHSRIGGPIIPMNPVTRKAIIAITIASFILDWAFRGSFLTKVQEYMNIASATKTNGK